MKISRFASFSLRDKGLRMGRNPKTAEAAAITARRVVVFRASAILKRRLGGEDTWRRVKRTGTGVL